MKKKWVFVALAICGTFAGAIALLWLAPIRASSGHWALTERLLQFTKRRAVALQSRSVDLRSLDDGRLVLLGAGHYETGCRFCHGAPGDEESPVLGAALPPPPQLSQVARDYEPRELFFIVRHGLKFTGMPAWPAANRDDEVWAVVAFLQKLPQLDPAGYAALVFGEERESSAAPPVPPLVASRCARCHGGRGLGRGRGAFPVLAGQKRAYLEKALVDYATGERASGMMQPIAVTLSKHDMDEVANWYAAQVPMETTPGGSDLGRSIAQQGIPKRRVPSCADCHGPHEHVLHESYPLLSGQSAFYLEQQLELFASGTRGGKQQAKLMRDAAIHALRPAEIAAIVAFYGGAPR